MMRFLTSALILSPLLLAASCGTAQSGDRAAAGGAARSAVSVRQIAGRAGVGFTVARVATLQQPWGAAFAPGTPWLFVTGKDGTIQAVDTENYQIVPVGGAPRVAYGGQGGLGDIAFLPWETMPALGTRTVYLSWAEAGPKDTRGAVVGRGRLVCDQSVHCAVEGLSVIWRQTPKLPGSGQYAYRLAFSPDRRYLYVSSGDRQHPDTAQDTGNDLGSIVRLTLDGQPAPGNPFYGQNGKAWDIWSWGHRNPLGLQFDAQGRLWDLEHGPAGGDELNLVRKGANYGWPLVSDGDHYNGQPIPRNATRPDLAQPALSWNPVIAPGDFIFYGGTMFPALDGEALIAGLRTESLIRVAFHREGVREVARYPFGARLREIVEGPDGAIWVLEDGPDAGLLKLTPG